MAEQLPLDLSQHNGAAGAGDFIVTPSNSEAVAIVDSWPDWPASTVAPALLLIGPPASGKSHLARVWAARAGAIVNGNGHDLNDTGSATVLDNCDTWVRDAQEGLFHLLNRAKEQNFPSLLCARTPVDGWALTLPDLLSRLKALPVAQLHQPDDELLAGLFARALSERGLQIKPEVLDFCLPRLPRDPAELASLANALDAFALATGKGLTLPVVREFFKTRA